MSVLRQIAGMARASLTHAQAIEAACSDSSVRCVVERLIQEWATHLGGRIDQKSAFGLIAQHAAFAKLLDVSSIQHPILVALSDALDSVPVAREFATHKETITAEFDDEMKQSLLAQLHDSIVRVMEPTDVRRHGIVHTPLEVVDFIVRSLDELVRDVFHSDLNAPEVQILDPFTGSGLFPIRLLSLGLISLDKPILAHEVYPLAAAAALLNADLVGRSSWLTLRLCDTFGEDPMKWSLSSGQNHHDARMSGLSQDSGSVIRVILGNPPYLVGKRDGADPKVKAHYPPLSHRIAETYGALSQTRSRKHINDSYIRALRWSSDAIGNNGVIAFITGNGWLSRPFADGVRASVIREFQQVIAIDLRGDSRVAILNKGQGMDGGVFGKFSSTGAAIVLMAKRSGLRGKSRAVIHDMGLGLSTNSKLQQLKMYGSISSSQMRWTPLEWQRPSAMLRRYERFVDLDDVFVGRSAGVSTNRDQWCMNFDRDELECRVRRLINAYNEKKEDRDEPESTTDIKWTDKLRRKRRRHEALIFHSEGIVPVLRYPFTKMWLYLDEGLNETTGYMKRIFCSKIANTALVVSGRGARNGFSCLMANTVVDHNLVDAGSKIYPRYWVWPDGSCRSGLNEAFVDRLQEALGSSISDDDAFAYVYAVLQLDSYRRHFAYELANHLARIPVLCSAQSIRALVSTGKRLVQLHSRFDEVPPYPARIECTSDSDDIQQIYAAPRKRVSHAIQCSGESLRVVFNDHLTIHDIPAEALEYRISGQSAVSWVLSKQVVRTLKKSDGINDPNKWAMSQYQTIRHNVDLLLRVVNVAMKTRSAIREVEHILIV